MRSHTMRVVAFGSKAMNATVLICIVCAGLATTAAEPMTAEQLLEHYRTEAIFPDRFVIKSETLVDGTDTAYGSDSSRVRVVSEFRKDGPRIDLASEEIWLQLPAPERTESEEEPRKYTRRVIWDGNRYVEAGGKWAFISEEERRKDICEARADQTGFLHGILPGDDEPLKTILTRNSAIELRPQTERVNGADCHVLDTVTPHGRYRLWIAPEYGYHITKVEASKSGDDIAGGRPLSSYGNPERLPGYKGTFPAKPLEIILSLDVVEFRKFGDVWIPTKGTYRRTKRHIDGRIITATKECRVTHVDLDPDFQAVGAFVPDIPDGTTVTVDGDERTAYRWSNGKPVANPR